MTDRNAILTAIIKVATLCLVVLSGIGSIFVFWVIPRQIRTPEVAVPNVVEQRYERAVGLITSAGLQVDPASEKKPSAELPKGYVIEQEPPANFKVKLNKSIRLTVSMGSETVIVPDVTGKLLNEADAVLKDAGFSRQRLAAVHSDRYPEINTVIAQRPLAGTAHQRDASVDLLLSLGLRSKWLRMPDFHQLPIDDVRALLESHGLKIGEEVVKPHPKINEGLIISQQPAAGELISVGSIVNLEVSGSRRTRTGNGRRIQIKHQVSLAGPPSKQVRIQVMDARGEREIVNKRYQSGMSVDAPLLRVFGQATVRVYEDDTLVKTEEFD